MGFVRVEICGDWTDPFGDGGCHADDIGIQSLNLPAKLPSRSEAVAERTCASTSATELPCPLVSATSGAVLRHALLQRD